MAFKLADLYVAITGERSGLNKTLDNVERDTKKRGSQLGKQLGGLIAGGVALGVAGISTVVGSALNFSGALNEQTDLLARQLNKTTDEAKEFENVIKRVFAGRSSTKDLETDAAAVGDVLQQLGDDADTLSDDQLVKLTESALNLSRVFEKEVSESMLTAGMLVKHGVAKDYEEALGIITAGFQNGLNVSGDFLDTLNEYSDDFARLGLDGAGALGLINRGLEAGIFNTDKIGDSINEFGINLKDPAVLESLKGMDGQIANIAQNFQSGYISEGAAFEGILERLGDIDDATVQNMIGVELFRGVWEDFGADGILALGNMSEGLIEHEGALTSLQPQYNSLSELGGSLWRRSLVALSPFSEKVLQLVNERLPLIESGFQWLEEEGIQLLNDAAEATANFVDAYVESEAPNGVLRLRDALVETNPEAGRLFTNLLNGAYYANVGLQFLRVEFGNYFSLLAQGLGELGQGILDIYPNYIRPFISNSMADFAVFLEQINTALVAFGALTGLDTSGLQATIGSLQDFSTDLSELTAGTALAGLGGVALPEVPTATGNLGAVTNNSAINIGAVNVQTQATQAGAIAATIAGALGGELQSAGVTP
jgi:hypothetical protein